MSHSETAEEGQGHLDREPTALWSKERMRAGMRVVEAALVYQRAYEAHEKCLATNRTSLIACKREHEALLTAHQDTRRFNETGPRRVRSDGLQRGVSARPFSAS